MYADGRLTAWLDGVSVAASLACMIHCLLLPVVFALLPMLTSTLDFGESFHQFVLIGAVPVSLTALVTTWRRHRRHAPLVAGACGLVCLSIALAFQESAVETLLTVSGSMLLASAHIANWRIGRRGCRVSRSTMDGASGGIAR